MDSFKEFFRLDHILRNCIGGAVFYLIIYPEIRQDSDVTGYLLGNEISWVNLAVISIAVSLTGILLHAMERNTTAIIAENLREIVIEVIDGKKRLQWVFPESARQESILRFEQMTNEERLSRLTAWGASAHCHYTVSIAMLAATFYLLVEYPSGNSYREFIIYFPLELFFLLLGFVSDVRKTLMESELKKAKTTPESATAPPSPA